MVSKALSSVTEVDGEPVRAWVVWGEPETGPVWPPDQMEFESEELARAYLEACCGCFDADMGEPPTSIEELLARQLQLRTVSMPPLDDSAIPF